MKTVCHHCGEFSDTCVSDFEGLARCEICADAETRTRWLADKARRERVEEAFQEQDREWERRRSSEFGLPNYQLTKRQAE